MLAAAFVLAGADVVTVDKRRFLMVAIDNRRCISVAFLPLVVAVVINRHFLKWWRLMIAATFVLTGSQG